MKYKKSKYYIENIDALKIAKKYGTPIYCYSKNKIIRNIIKFKNNFESIKPLICFSVKSNNNLQILKLIQQYQLGADVVSKGELIAALKAGIPSKKIVFSGVGKTADEIRYAIDKNILLINAESESEIININSIARNKRRPVNVGLRLNPNIDALTNSKISTGRNIDKFGLNEKTISKLIVKYKNSKHIKIKCLSVHIGSQITELKPYAEMIRCVSKFIEKIKYHFDYIDFGGGMGIQYKNNEKKLNYKKYLFLVKKFVNKYRVKIIFEPGRSIIGNTAVLLSKIIYIKKTNKRNFVIVDAAMNDLIRPALYGSYHKIIPLKKNQQIINKLHNFVGPICETTDQFSVLKRYFKLNDKDFLAICDVGAYGIVLSSNYNLRPRPSELMIDKSKVKLISRRETLKDII